MKIGTLSDEIKSVYVRNLPSTVSASEIEEEFKRFGRISPDGVVIRSRKVNILTSSDGCSTSFMPILKLNFLLISRMLVFAMRLLNLKI